MLYTGGGISIASALAFLYKPLCDKYGRRPFLVLNTLGMGAVTVE